MIHKDHCGISGKTPYAAEPMESEYLTLGAHAQEGYRSCPACLFVCLSVGLLPLKSATSFGLPKVYTCGSLLIRIVKWRLPN